MLDSCFGFIVMISDFLAVWQLLLYIKQLLCLTDVSPLYPEHLLFCDNSVIYKQSESCFTMLNSCSAYLMIIFDYQAVHHTRQLPYHAIHLIKQLQADIHT